MYYNKRKSYTGRWIVKLVEATLIFGIIFFGLDAIGQLLQPAPSEYIIRDVVVQQGGAVEAVIEAPQLDAADYFHLGLEHQLAGDYYDAVIDYTRSINQDAAIAPSWLNRGVAYEQLRNGYRAMFDFQRYMERDGINIRELPTLSTNANAVVQMTYNTRFDVPLNLRAGDVINISAVSSTIDRVDPIIVLVDENNQPVAANDDVRRGDGSLIVMDSYINNLNITESGTYRLYVSHAGGGYQGDVAIQIKIDR